MPALDRWLIDMATTNPPSGREEWARAMRAEFDMLERGRTGWALGCLTAAVGWRLLADLSFILAAAFSVLLLAEIIPQLQFWLFVWLGESHRKFYSAVAYAWVWGPVALSSLALATLRPRYWLMISLSLPLVAIISSWVHGFVAFRIPISSLLTDHLMDARMDVGMGALIGYALIGALIGKALNHAAPIALNGGAKA